MNIKNYIDMTEEWLKNAKPNSHELLFDDYFIDDDGVKHPIKGKEVVHYIPRVGKEYERAVWIKSVFGGDVHLVPRITDISNTGISTSTPDFRWNGKKWDLKTPGINGKFSNAIERFVKKSNTKKQAKCLIIDFVNFPDKLDYEIKALASKVLNNKCRNWIEALMLVRKNKVIGIYIKQKRALVKQMPGEELSHVITSTLYYSLCYKSIKEEIKKETVLLQKWSRQGFYVSIILFYKL